LSNLLEALPLAALRLKAARDASIAWGDNPARTQFREFLKHWKFVDREEGTICSLESLWPGQETFCQAMLEHQWIIALKAGKLGFTELECAWDAFRLLGPQKNARVHLFSRDASASRELLGIIRFGIEHLPAWLRPEILADAAGGDTSQSMKFRVGPDDIRTIISYSSGTHVSIDQNCQHAHVDEIAHMPFPDTTWNAVRTTVSPGGTCHVLSRGLGDANFLATLWRAAQEPGSDLYPVFAPWIARPGRDQQWYDLQSMALTPLQLQYFAPETPEDALAGDLINVFVPIELWDLCYDSTLPYMFDPQSEGLTGSKIPVVIGVDAATTGDCFGIVAVTRNPKYPQDVCVRAVRAWKPPGGGVQIDYAGPEAFLRTLILGGCALGHPLTPDRQGIDPRYQHVEYGASCPACADRVYIPGYNVVMIIYDPMQLEDMMQRLNRELGVWKRGMPQGKERLVSDKLLRDLIIGRRLSHSCNPQDVGNPLWVLREHINNSAAKIPRDEDNKIRIIKKAPDRKVDLAVALSMAASECLRLML